MTTANVQEINDVKMLKEEQSKQISDLLNYAYHAFDASIESDWTHYNGMHSYDEFVKLYYAEHVKRMEEIRHLLDTVFNQ